MSSLSARTVALVTGANRGLGRALVEALVARGVRVYAAARDPRSIDAAALLAGAPAHARVIPLQLDVTSSDDIAAAVTAAPDVDLVINNAGISRASSLLAADALVAARAELETNVLGPLALARAFAPTLARNGGGGVINVLSVLSWIALPAVATYSMSKAAAWSMTNGLRGELAANGTHVAAVHVGFMDTDMASGVTQPKSAPADVAQRILDGYAAGEREILADAISAHVKHGLSAADAPYL